MGTHRVVRLFQPHRYTRTQLLLEDYGSAFAKADVLIVTDVYSAGEDPIPGVTGRQLPIRFAKKTGQDVIYIPHTEDVVTYLKEHARPLDLIITMEPETFIKWENNTWRKQKDKIKKHEHYYRNDETEKKIAVVVGGPSSEAEVSRNTGAAIAKKR